MYVPLKATILGKNINSKNAQYKTYIKHKFMNNYKLHELKIKLLKQYYNTKIREIKILINIFSTNIIIKCEHDILREHDIFLSNSS